MATPLQTLSAAFGGGGTGFNMPRNMSHLSSGQARAARYNRQVVDAFDRYNRQNMAPRRGGGSSARADAAANFDRLMDLTEGRADDILNDSRMRAALDAFQQTVDGGGPFSDDVVAGLRSRLADQSAAVAADRRDQIARDTAARGGSAYDASAQAAGRRVDERLAQSNQTDARELAIQAALGNYDAQQQAARDLMQARSGQYSLGNPLAQQAADYYSRKYDEPLTPYRSPSMQTSQRITTTVPNSGRGYAGNTPRGGGSGGSGGNGGNGGGNGSGGGGGGGSRPRSGAGGWSTPMADVGKIQSPVSRGAPPAPPAPPPTNRPPSNWTYLPRTVNRINSRSGTGLGGFAR